MSRPVAKVEYGMNSAADTGRCPCCGHVSRKVLGFVHRDGEPHASYLVHWTVGHIFEHGVHIDLIVGAPLEPCCLHYERLTEQPLMNAHLPPMRQEISLSGSRLYLHHAGIDPGVTKYHGWLLSRKRARMAQTASAEKTGSATFSRPPDSSTRREKHVRYPS